MLAARATGVVLCVALIAVGCSGSTKPPAATTGSAGTTTAPAQTTSNGPPPSQFLAVDASAKSVTITLIAAYDGDNSGFNFDGYSRELMWTVPRGWKIHVVCKNRGPLRHSCAVVQGAGTTTLSFPGASTPQPQTGLRAGTTAEFTFTATKTGVYRFVCLVPGHAQARMWDVLKIVPHGKPSAVDLRAS